MAYAAVFPQSIQVGGMHVRSFLRSMVKMICLPDQSAHIQEKAIQRASSEQVGHLLEQYGNHILRLAYSYLHNMEDAEDILQDTMIQYIHSAPSFEQKKSEKAWLMRVAANLSKNKIRYNKLRETDMLDENLKGPGEEDLLFIWEAVKQLPVKYREVIHLFYYEEYTTAEIAKIIGRKESTVRSDLRRGRLALKSILKEEYDFEG